MGSRQTGRGDGWQAYADLAMGLMAMLTLILLILLAKQQQTSIQLDEARNRSESELVAVRAERARLDELRVGLEKERSAFALELEELFDLTFTLVARQDAAEAWISSLFDESDCLLTLGPTGSLDIVDPDSRLRQSAGLYDSGATKLSVAGQQALTSCRDAFVRLAYCLSPMTADSEDSEGRRRICGGETPPESELLDRLGVGIEAVVLEGSTDRIPYGATPGIQSESGRVRLTPTGESFASNAYLGAERARQAMGYLVGLVQEFDRDPYDAHEVLLARLSVESTSFGRYQVGPPDWRLPGCDGSANCDAARNLSLRLRWRKEELRKPLETIRRRVCALAADPDSAFVRGLAGAGVEPADLLSRLRCDEAGEP